MITVNNLNSWSFDITVAYWGEEIWSIFILNYFLSSSKCVCPPSFICYDYWSQNIFLDSQIFWAYILRPCLKFLSFLFNHLPWDISGWSLENSHWKLIFWKGSRKRLHLQKFPAESCGYFIMKPASKSKMSLFDKRSGSLN